LTTPCCSTGNVGSVLRGKLVITLPAYSRAARSHTSGVLTRRSYSHFRRTHAPLVVTLPAYSRAARRLAVSVTPGVVSSRCSHTPCVGSLFSRYPSRLAWSRRDLLTRLCVGSLFFAVFVTRGVVSSRSSHTPCVGSLFSRYPSRLAWSRCSYRSGGRSAGSRVERGRSVERDNRLRGEESPD